MDSASIKALSVACVLTIAALVGAEQVSFAQNTEARTEATSCAAAIAGNVTASTVSVICGIPPEVLDALVKSRTQLLGELASALKDANALLKQNLDLNQRQIRAALDTLGETNVPPELLAAKLVEIAEGFKAFQQRAIARPGEDPNIVALKADADKAVGEGDRDKADALLADVELQQRQARERLAADEAETAAKRGDIAITRLRYAEAARRYADATAVLASESIGKEKRLDYINREANALYQQGVEFGDNDALREAIDRYRRILDLQPRERMPLDWARTYNKFGNALSVLGEREFDTAKLEEAIAAYHEALKELSRELVPLEWAMMQTNLGTAVLRLGEREGDTAKLEEAIDAFREALKERTHERAPLDWAMTEANLGNALTGLGEREDGTDKLEAAVAAYREALKELTSEHASIDWAVSTGNQGIALLYLAERKRDAATAQTAEVQFEIARDALTKGGQLSAAYYEKLRKMAHSVAEQLKRR